MNRPPSGRRQTPSPSSKGSRIPSPSPSRGSTSRIPSPPRKLGASIRSSRTSTPNRSRSASVSPSVENLSPIRATNKDSSGVSRRTITTPEYGSGKNLVRYITHDLIKRLSKQDDFDLIKSLTFNLSGEKKIRFIENLDGLRTLSSLNLNGNVIQKMEKLDHLSQLKSLNLANNQIIKIEGIESMTNLQTLNLEQNLIDKIPAWLPKKLRSLRTLKLANNEISSLSEIVRLRGLHDLTTLTISGNPLCVLHHHRSYVIFQLKVLQQVDHVNVTSKERTDSNNRFSQEELERVTKELNDTVQELESTREVHNKSVEEVEMYLAKEREYNDQYEKMSEERSQMEREIAAKDDLLRKKNKELQRAQAKNQDLEQELAFMKIDNKFEPLNYSHVEDEEDENDIPYIGKSRYKKNQFAHEMNLPSTLHQQRLREEAARRELDKSLTDKQQQLNDAAERLAQLQEMLRETQKQIRDAQKELAELERKSEERKMTEEEKQKMRDNMKKKMEKVDKANRDVEEIEDAVRQARRVLHQSRQESEQTKRQMRNMDQSTDDFKDLQSSMEAKEEGMKELVDTIGENERKLDKLLKATAIDTEHIKKLENQLERGMTSQDDALRNELEGVIAGLHDYLRNVRKKADDQRQQFDQLLQDKEGLIRRLARLEEEKARLEADIDDYNNLQQQLSALNESMSEMQDMNNSLQRQTTDKSVQNEQINKQLDEAKNKINQLNKSIQQAEKEGNSKKSALSKQAEELAKIKQILDDKTEQVLDYEDEIKRLNANNLDMQREMELREDGFNETLGDMLRPRDIVKRINKLRGNVARGENPVLKEDSDEVDGALKNLLDLLNQVIDRESKEKGNAERKLKDVETNAENMKNKLLDAQKEYRDALNAATQAKLDEAKIQHELDLSRRKQQVKSLEEKLKEAEQDGRELRKKLEKDRRNKENEEKLREERDQLLADKSDANLRNLQRELEETKRKAKDRKNEDEKKIKQNSKTIRNLNKKLEQLEEDKQREIEEGESAEEAAKRAMKDLQRAEDEIEALYDLLQAYENDGGAERRKIRKLRNSLGKQHRSVDRLRKNLRRCKYDNEDEVTDLLKEIDFLRQKLSAFNSNARALWPSAICYTTPALSPVKCLPQHGGFFYSSPMHGLKRESSRRKLNFESSDDDSIRTISVGQPGIINIDEYGNPFIAPFNGLFCNVAEHHKLEDDISTLQEELKRKDELINSCNSKIASLEQIVGPVEEARLKMEHLKSLISDHEHHVHKLRREEEKAALDKIQVENQLVSLRTSLGNKMKKKNQLENKVNQLLGELHTEQQLIEHEQLQEELDHLERCIAKKKKELRKIEALVRQQTAEATHLEKEAAVLKKKNEDSYAKLTETEQEFEELERQSKEAASKLIRARNDVRQLEDEKKCFESSKLKLDDQCKQLARVVSNKEAEYTALEGKTEQMTENLEKLQTELIVTEEKESERLNALKESEKILNDRKLEINSLEDQVCLLNDQVKNLERSIGKKSTELQLVQENLEQQQNELASVLNRGRVDVAEKQKKIKELRRKVDELEDSKDAVDRCVEEARTELNSAKEDVDEENKKLHQIVSDVMRQKSEMKHLVEMVELEKQELASVRKQYEGKVEEVKQLQQQAFEGRDEVERVKCESDKKKTEVDRYKQTLEKLRNNLACSEKEANTLDSTVNTLTKEKELLEQHNFSLNEKIENGKADLSEIKDNVDKIRRQFKEVETELTETKQELSKIRDEKFGNLKEVSVLKKQASDYKCEIDSYTQELQETQEQLKLVEQENRRHNRCRDDVLVEIVHLNEQITSLRQKIDLLQKNETTRAVEVEKIQEKLRKMNEDVIKKENEMEMIQQNIDLENSKYLKDINNLKERVSNLKFEVHENTIEVEQLQSKRDNMVHEMERLGRVNDKFIDLESKCSKIRQELENSERSNLILTRNNEDMESTISNLENDLRLAKNKLIAEIQTLNEKIALLEDHSSRDSKEIKSLESTAQEHCDRANRLSKELNNIRLELIHQKQQLRYKEEEFLKQVRESGHVERSLREEVRSAHDQLALIISSNKKLPVDDLGELYKKQRDMQKKVNKLKQIDRQKNPNLSSTRKDKNLQKLQDDLQKRQEEIAYQIKQRVNRQKEQIEARQKLSEGKLLSLKKKLDNLDEIVSTNTSVARDENLSDL